MLKELNLIGNATARFFLHTRQIKSIIGVQWRQENPNPRVHRSRLPCYPFPLERWTLEFGFSCRHWTSMVDSFSHTTSPNVFSLSVWTWKCQEVNERIKSAKSNNFGTKMFLLFQLRKRIPTLAILFTNKGAIDVRNFGSLLHKPTCLDVAACLGSFRHNFAKRRECVWYKDGVLYRYGQNITLRTQAGRVVSGRIGNLGRYQPYPTIPYPYLPYLGTYPPPNMYLWGTYTANLTYLPDLTLKSLYYTTKLHFIYLPYYPFYPQNPYPYLCTTLLTVLHGSMEA